MASPQSHDQTFADQTFEKLRSLCRKPTNPDSKTQYVIPDKDFQEIGDCLRDLENEDASDRPRTYAVLHMMGRIDLLTAFVAAGLFDNSFPYPDRRSLPPLMRRDHDACHQFLELQIYVMSAVCQMEKGMDSKHVHVDSGDTHFQSLRKLGKGGEACVYLDQ
jgi:hypothetical protein